MLVDRRPAFMATVGLLAFGVAACSSSGGASTTATTARSGVDTTASSAPTAESASSFPVVETVSMPESPDDLGSLTTDGEHLYALRMTNGEATRLADLDPETGRVIVERPIVPPSEARPSTAGSRSSRRATRPASRTATVSMWRSSTPTRSRYAARTPPENTRSELVRTAAGSPMWVGHVRYDEDRLAGRDVRRHVAPRPGCGRDRGHQVGASVWHQGRWTADARSRGRRPRMLEPLAAIDLKSGVMETVAVSTSGRHPSDR